MSGLIIPPFQSKISRSRIWLFIVVLLHTLFLMSVLWADQMLWLSVIPLTLWLALASDGWLPGRQIISKVVVDAKGRLWVQRGANPHLIRVQLLGNSFRGVWFIVLNLRCDKKHYSVTLWPDSAPKDFQHHLRVYLRWFPHLLGGYVDGMTYSIELLCQSHKIFCGVY